MIIEEKDNKPSISILLGTKEDIDEVAKMYDTVNDYLAATVNYPGWKKGIYPARIDAENAVREKSLHLARIGEKIVGSVVLNHKPEEAFRGVKWLIDEEDYSKIIVVRTLMILPEYLGQGIAGEMIDYTFDFAKANEFKSIRLDVYEKNIPAIKLYEKKNYQYIDTVDLGLKEEFGLKYFKLYEKIVSCH